MPSLTNVTTYLESLSYNTSQIIQITTLLVKIENKQFFYELELEAMSQSLPKEDAKNLIESMIVEMSNEKRKKMLPFDVYIRCMFRPISNIAY